jgi:hypothetical protein
VADRIIIYLKLTFVAAKPLPPRIAYHELLMAAEASPVNIFHDCLLPQEETPMRFLAFLSFPAASWPATRFSQLELTSHLVTIYNF